VGLFLSILAFLGSLGFWAARLLPLPEELAFLASLSALPEFVGTALALFGLLCAYLVYRKRKGKKRRFPMAMMVLCTIAAILCTLLWLHALLQGRGLITI